MYELFVAYRRYAEKENETKKVVLKEIFMNI